MTCCLLVRVHLTLLKYILGCGIWARTCPGNQNQYLNISFSFKRLVSLRSQVQKQMRADQYEHVTDRWCFLRVSIALGARGAGDTAAGRRDVLPALRSPPVRGGTWDERAPHPWETRAVRRERSGLTKAVLSLCEKVTPGQEPGAREGSHVDI